MIKVYTLLGLAVGMTAVSQAITWRADVVSTAPDPTYNDQFAVGVFQYADNPSDRRSGVLIGDRYVLTAGHNFRWGIATTFTIANRVYQVQNFSVHPQYTTAGVANDICVARLATRVTNILPVKVNYSTLTPNQFAYLAGAGGAGPSTRITTWGWVPNSGTNRISAVQTGMYTTTFDRPGNAATPFEAHIMPGDSGGGLFVDVLNGKGVSGVISSRTGADYGATAYYTRTDIHRAFILDRAWESGRVEGKIDLSDFGGTTSGIEATVQLFDPSTAVRVGQFSVILAPQGNFSFATTLRGTFNARIFARNWLAKMVNAINIQTNSSTRLNVSLTNGDVTMSGRVDQDDVAAVQNAVNSGIGPVRMDVNGDGVFSAQDVQIVQANIGQIGQ